MERPNEIPPSDEVIAHRARRLIADMFSDQHILDAIEAFDREADNASDEEDGETNA